MRARNYAALVAALAASGLILAARGDEPTRLGRLFRPTTPTPALAPTPASELPPDLPPLTPVQPRIVPQPRVSRAVTEADPLVTRIALGRSDDGSQFGMFLMVYADGTVIDSEGVHRLGRDALKDVTAALSAPTSSGSRGIAAARRQTSLNRSRWSSTTAASAASARAHSRSRGIRKAVTMRFNT